MTLESHCVFAQTMDCNNIKRRCAEGSSKTSQTLLSRIFVRAVK
jgi:hypothetical protein